MVQVLEKEVVTTRFQLERLEVRQHFRTLHNEVLNGLPVV
jgi:hypothetical protein